MYVAGHTAYFFCHVKMSHVARCIAAGPKKSEIGVVLSELDDLAVASINRNRAFNFSPEYVHVGLSTSLQKFFEVSTITIDPRLLPSFQDEGSMSDSSRIIDLTLIIRRRRR